VFDQHLGTYSARLSNNQRDCMLPELKAPQKIDMCHPRGLLKFITIM